MKMPLGRKCLVPPSASSLIGQVLCPLGPLWSASPFGGGGVEAERMRGINLSWSPLLCLWRRRKEIYGVLSPLIMTSLLYDKDKGPTHSPLDSNLGAGGKTFWVSLPPSEKGCNNTGVTCELPSC